MKAPATGFRSVTKGLRTFMERLSIVCLYECGLRGGVKTSESFKSDRTLIGWPPRSARGLDSTQEQGGMRWRKFVLFRASRSTFNPKLR